MKTSMMNITVVDQSVDTITKEVQLKNILWESYVEAIL